MLEDAAILFDPHTTQNTYVHTEGETAVLRIDEMIQSHARGLGTVVERARDTTITVILARSRR